MAKSRRWVLHAFIRIERYFFNYYCRCSTHERVHRKVCRQRLLKHKLNSTGLWLHGIIMNTALFIQKFCFHFFSLTTLLIAFRIFAFSFSPVSVNYFAVKHFPSQQSMIVAWNPSDFHVPMCVLLLHIFRIRHFIFRDETIDIVWKEKSFRNSSFHWIGLDFNAFSFQIAQCGHTRNSCT